jgi:glycine cleavage system transcriptional repressor
MVLAALLHRKLLRRHRWLPHWIFPVHWQPPGKPRTPTPRPAHQTMEKLLAITAIGPDRAGVVRDLSQAITNAGGNIRESRMIALGAEFAVLMLVAGNWHTVSKLQAQIELLQQQAGLTITLRETQSRTTEASAPYLVDVVTLDHEGIVFGLSNFFAQRSLDIPEVSTRRYNAPHTGAPMFAVQMTVSVPRHIHVATLRDEFMEYCDENNLDAVMEPAQR